MSVHVQIQWKDLSQYKTINITTIIIIIQKLPHYKGVSLTCIFNTQLGHMVVLKGLNPHTEHAGGLYGQAPSGRLAGTEQEIKSVKPTSPLTEPGDEWCINSLFSRDKAGARTKHRRSLSPIESTKQYEYPRNAKHSKPGDNEYLGPSQSIVL